ncbi:sigma-70 family RNA polymerase sigma factor [Lancefieldella rimae]|uniref:sigma-70 family RNA polymerase sigma factor n=1 Tax=Lancefieldella rimae TaxID=1383 RepID=UPI001CB18193|nr:sigma-70 family RNA polymerase sigma factor [Lancefieldella rimae]MBF4804167.1 sigma-70 family RNA polymerase sigma factor [Lancefieldella rimae]
MFCPNCGNEVPQSARFCKYCGCKLALLKTAPSRETDIKAAYEKNIDTLAKTIAAFKENHDQSTFSSLFEQTKGIVTKAICDQGVDGRDVEDVVQQVYLTAYQKLDSLEDNRAAFAWFKRTATNKAIDHMRKSDNAPILNTDYTNDTSDSSDYIESLADDTLELPEDVVENTSTQQIIRGFIQELPKDQQKFLVARYFAEMNAAQIAETFGIPAGTVRSQLSRARKTLQESILAYSERTGIKLASYSSVPVFALLANADLAPVPLTLNAPSLFSTIQETMQGLGEVTKALGEKGLSAQGAPYTNPFIDEFAKSTAAHTSQAAQTSAAQAAGSAGTSAGSTGATAASTGSASVGTKGASTATKVATTTAKATQAAGTVAKMSIGGKIAAGVATVAIAGATAGGVYFAGTNGLIPFIPKPQEPIVQTQQQVDDSPSQTDVQSNSDEPEPEPEPVSEEDQMKQAMYEQYSEIIDNAPDYFSTSTLNISSLESPQYVYSLVYMDPNNPQIPQLLLNLKSTGDRGSFDYILIFNFDESNKQAFPLQMEYPIYGGVAGMGGYRGVIRATSDGSGLLSIQWYSGSGQTEVRRYVVSGHDISSTTEWEGRIDQYPKDPSEIDIDWCKVTDKSGLEQIAPSNN